MTRKPLNYSPAQLDARARRMAKAPPPPLRKQFAPPGECAYCDEHREDTMMPPHDPSRFCESGKRNHCTCDVCF
jgi:hypothetical protein